MDSSIEKLRDDIHYYGSFGQNYLSNSDIGALLTDPEKFRKPKEKISQYCRLWSSCKSNDSIKLF